MNSFHGTDFDGAVRLLENPVAHEFPGLWVTDTSERAARYANARASRRVDFDATEIVKHAVVLTIEASDDLKFSRRGNNLDAATATSLDQVEALIRYKSAIKVVDAQYVECDYEHCSCHKRAAKIREIMAK